ncbi:MAG: hypothetical protein V4613_01825 [Bacteroidota bacterium]
MIAINHTDKYTTWLIRVAFVFLFWLAIRFYFERLYTDAGYYFFHTVNSGFFHVEHGRFVLVLAELLPAIGTWLHLPLKVLALLYSINHVLFSALLVYIAIKKLNNLNAGLMITLIQFAGIRFSIVTPQFELYYGLSLLILLMAFIQFYQTTSKGPLFYSIASLLTLLVFTSHPMAIYCFYCIMALMVPVKKDLKIWLMTFLLLAVYIIWKKTGISTYEKGKFDVFNNAFSIASIHKIFKPNTLLAGLKLLTLHYWDVVIMYFCGIFVLLKNKRYWYLAIYIVAIKCIAIIIWLMFPPGSVDRYIEQVYFPFVFIALLWLPTIKLNYRLLALVGIIIVIRAYGMFGTGLRYSGMTAQIREFANKAQQQNGTKFYVPEGQMGKEYYEMGNWSYGFQTMYYSAIHCKKTVSITKQEDMEYNNNQSELKADEFLFRPFDRLPIKTLNARYFVLDTGRYQLLKLP